MRRIALGVVITALLVLTANADAHTRKFTTGGSVGAQYVTDTVSGTITSPKDECEVGRLVTVTRNGGFYGQDITDADGDWSVSGGDIDGSHDIGVTVSRKILKKTATHKHICKKLFNEV